MNILIAPENVIGLGVREQEMLRKLLTVYQNATAKNDIKNRY